MMYLAQRKEQFSHAYVRAVASVAGYATYKPDVDGDSVDLGIADRGLIGQMFLPRLEFQLKCTSVAAVADKYLAFPLKRKNYDDLRVEDAIVPHLLVVVRVPEEELAWLAQAEDEMILRRCGYWLSLRGGSCCPRTPYRSSARRAGCSGRGTRARFSSCTAWSSAWTDRMGRRLARSRSLASWTASPGTSSSNSGKPTTSWRSRPTKTAPRSSASATSSGRSGDFNSATRTISLLSRTSPRSRACYELRPISL